MTAQTKKGADATCNATTRRMRRTRMKKCLAGVMAINVMAATAFVSQPGILLSNTARASLQQPAPSPSSSASLRQQSISSLSMTALIGPPPPQAPPAALRFGDKMIWQPGGYESWEWQGHHINYAVMGDEHAPPLLLIHGFGASAFHWRYNLPALADQGYRVYAMDLLGFGLSAKPLIKYTANTWRDQAVAFMEEVIRKPTVVAGNSLGGYAALAAASAAGPNVVKGCVLINAAGRFDPAEGAAEGNAFKELTMKKGANGAPTVFEQMKVWFQKALITASFYYTKQPLRIKQVLQTVYSVHPRMVDDELVESIRFPAENPNAPEVFFRVITKGGNLPATFNEMLACLKVPLLLLWGEKDPWIQPVTADRIQELYPAKRVSIDAGHCPHDEAPHAVNSAMVEWLNEHVQWEL